MKWMPLLALMVLLGCGPEAPRYDQHIRDYNSEHQPEQHHCGVGMKFSGGLGVPLSGCGPGLVLGFDGKLHFGMGF